MTGVNHTSCPNVSKLIRLQKARVVHCSYRWWSSLMTLHSSRPDIFNSTGVPLWSLSFLFCFFVFFLFSFLPYNSRRERKVKKINKKTSEAHQSFGDNITSRVRKISMIWIQQHEGRSPTITGVRYTSHLKASDIQHIWMTFVAHFTHRS
jgi:hypothetical protein